MTQAEKQKRVLEYIERGKEIGTKEHTKTETLGISQIKGNRQIPQRVAKGGKVCHTIGVQGSTP